MTPAHGDPAHFPRLAEITNVLLQEWPKHEAYLAKSFIDPAGLVFAEELAAMIARLTEGRLSQACADYRWTCEALVDEEIHFRRTGTYRLSTFAEAEAQVYGRPDFMAPYLNGLLLSQLFWAHHRGVMAHYRDVYLPRRSGRHLEVGPGHGLLLFMAARSGRFDQVAGWDVSATSLDHTGAALDKLGGAPVALARHDILGALPASEAFDSIVASEVLEHLEQPEQALATFRALLAPGGQLFVNVPVNSPAPDHIRLFSTPEEVVEIVRQAGFDIIETAFFPLTGYSLEKARKTKTTISCAVTAVRA